MKRPGTYIRNHLLLLIALSLAACLPANRTPITPSISSPEQVDTAIPSPEPVIPAAVPDTPTPVEPTPTEIPAPSILLAYVGQDDNIWLMDRSSGEQRQVTQDAAGFEPGSTQSGPTITYSNPLLSSDARLLVFQQDVGTSNQSGYNFEFKTWVLEIPSGKILPILEGVDVRGMAWKPGTHLLAYTQLTDPAYFTARGQVDSSLAKGIWALDVDKGELAELVPPERGYSLIAPQWSPDGRFIGFDEIYLMEGRGNFAYYDFEAKEYIPWDEAIGSYSWSPDAGELVYDRKTYTPAGDERIVLRARVGGEELSISTQIEPGEYAFQPHYSPDGAQIAYLVGTITLENTMYRLFLQDLPDGELRLLGEFDQVQTLGWSPDGSRLYLSAGAYEQPRIFEIILANGTVNDAAQGSQPSVATR